jgi:epoxide hydrolase 4
MVDRAEEGFVDSDGVKIHYVASGEGPLVIMLHGFPDYWYTWRKQIPALSHRFKVVAIDLRGYNKSDQPVGIENYTFEKLLGDVKAVIAHFGYEKATLIGHDWGGVIAWRFAMTMPGKIDRLVVLNVAHPAGIQRELASNPAQQKASQYARNYMQPDAVSKVQLEDLVYWVTDPDARREHLEALQRSSLDAMFNYYKANFPRDPVSAEATQHLLNVSCPVLVLYGLQDKYLLPSTLNDVWLRVANSLTLITFPDVGHFIQQDAAELVTKHIVDWLVDPRARPGSP